jgi:oxygen-independent coproporphyrinogen-3 oxidase
MKLPANAHPGTGASLSNLQIAYVSLNTRKASRISFIMKHFKLFCVSRQGPHTDSVKFHVIFLFPGIIFGVMMPGIYIHLPFCKVHCSYCDFPITTRRSLAKRYYAALMNEIAMHRPKEIADTLYFGGGTPSLTIIEVLAEIKSRFVLHSEAEITLEANPDDIELATVKEWKKLGINRVSLGVQSLEDTALRAMLRAHSADDALHAFSMIRSASFDSLNVDLIVGTPAQTENGFLNGVQTLIAERPDHFSIYFLELHERTALYRQVQSENVSIMKEEAQIRCFTEAVEMLRKNGYEHYEVSNFALPGKTSRHNLKYWNNEPYYAYGAGACAYIDQTRTSNISSIQKYLESLESERLPVESAIHESKETQMRNFIIFGLRKRSGINVTEFQAMFGMSPLELFPERANLLENRMLEFSENRLRLTFTGMLVSNEILSQVV